MGGALCPAEARGHPARRHEPIVRHHNAATHPARGGPGTGRNQPPPLFMMPAIIARLILMTHREASADKQLFPCMDAPSLVSLYWAVTTLITVGFGDVSAASRGEMIVR